MSEQPEAYALSMYMYTTVLAILYVMCYAMLCDARRCTGCAVFTYARTRGIYESTLHLAQIVCTVWLWVVDISHSVLSKQH